MGYYVRKMNIKKTSPNCKIQIVSYKKSHCKASSAKKPKKEWDVPKHQWHSLGFNQSMNIEQARARAMQLNAKEKSKNIEARQQIFMRNRRQFEDECRAIFPDLFKRQFEEQFIFGRYNSPAEKGTRSHWHAAQRLLLKLALDPEDWFEHTHEFYDYLVDHQYSVSYSSKILRMVNLWGFFISKKLGKPFMPISRPRGRHKRQLQEAFYRKNWCYRQESDPITPNQLKKVIDTLNTLNFNWLYLSVWLGLRPKEIDQLTGQKTRP